MIIYCPHCDTKVTDTILYFYDDFSNNNIIFLKCLQCDNVLIIEQEYDITSFDSDGTPEWKLGKPRRIWPEPEKYLNSVLPKNIELSLDEASKCLKAAAYYACAVICGRTSEAICNKYKTKNKYLEGGLKELLDMGIIDKRIFEQGNILRKYRNIGAHPNPELISKKDTKYLLDFAFAILEYIFVLTARFREFMKECKIEIL